MARMIVTRPVKEDGNNVAVTLNVHDMEGVMAMTDIPNHKALEQRRVIHPPLAMYLEATCRCVSSRRGSNAPVRRVAPAFAPPDTLPSAGETSRPLWERAPMTTGNIRCFTSLCKFVGLNRYSDQGEQSLIRVIYPIDRYAFAAFTGGCKPISNPT